ncbi:MAG TPA: 2-amino-4-hydroxy-6-hydroxymethyldihydropteridine diphosphokinase [Armatimonadota bacterium]|jgi:dihydroneopterin aldolase/2-amino-4-hydroxy-6-hydroxymethyldihydropteridine diphosphokinase
MAKVFIGIGSNIDPEENVRRALSLLRKAVSVHAVSTFYRTRPVGVEGLPEFCNGIVEIETALPPDELKRSVLARIEEDLGRVRTGNKYASRTIDLDIVLYDAFAGSEDPDIARRAFLAIPLCELRPDLVLPSSGASIKEIAESMSKSDMKSLPELTEQLRRELQDEQSQS